MKIGSPATGVANNAVKSDEKIRKWSIMMHRKRSMSKNLAYACTAFFK